jgi:hypothetical protein
MTDNNVNTERGFAEGAHIVLRPVLEKDLLELAPLMAQNPCERKPTPWTLQRLKKKFEDDKEPGLWGKGEKFYVAVRRTGGVVGFLIQRGDNRVFWITVHVDDKLEDRDALGLDLLRAYESLMMDWHDPVRIGCEIIRPEIAKAGWLKQAGYELEVVFEKMQMYLGEAVAVEHYGWIAPAYRELAEEQRC